MFVNQTDDALDCLTVIIVKHVPPEQTRSDNGPEFAAKAARAQHFQAV